MLRYTGISSLFLLIASISNPSAAQSVGGDPFQPIYVDSLKCNADGTKGCTAHREVSISAGPDRVFVPESLKFRENSRSGGGSIWARIRNGQMINVPVAVAGVEYRLEMPRTVVVELHAESGSGPGNYNRGAWLNGYLDGRTLEVER